METLTKPKKIRCETGELAHHWANKTHDEGSSGGRFHFNGDCIYSYGMLLARHETRRGQAFVLLTPFGYSGTTSRHKNCVIESIKHLVSFTVPLDATPTGCFKSYLKRYDKLLNEATSSRDGSKTQTEAFRSAISLAAEANEFAALFGLKSRITAVKSLRQAQDHVDAADRKSASKSKRDAAAERRNKEAAQAEFDKKLKLWRRGKGRLPSHEFTYFRLLSDEQIETSHSVKFSTDAASHAYQMLKLLHDAGKNFHAGTQIKVDDWYIDSMEGDVVRAGCHKVEWSEIAAFAKGMGWDK